MQYNPNKHHRQSIRLNGYDYSREGVYFITICTQNMECLFGEIVKCKMVLNDIGRMVESELLYTSELRKNVEIDELIIMPDHIHFIINIKELFHNPVGAYCIRPTLNSRPTQDSHEYQGEYNNEGYKNRACINRAYINRAYINRAYINTPLRSPSQTIGAIVRGFKSAATKQINLFRNVQGVPIWQRNYFEEIIRDENQLNKTREYIINNPMKWELNKKNSKNFKTP